MKRLTQIGLLLALGAAFAPRSEAREITFIFTGTVTRLEIADVHEEAVACANLALLSISQARDGQRPLPRLSGREGPRLPWPAAIRRR